MSYCFTVMSILDRMMNTDAIRSLSCRCVKAGTIKLVPLACQNGRGVSRVTGAYREGTRCPGETTRPENLPLCGGPLVDTLGAGEREGADCRENQGSLPSSADIPLTSNSDINEGGRRHATADFGDHRIGRRRRHGRGKAELTKQMSAVRNRPRPPARTPPAHRGRGLRRFSAGLCAGVSPCGSVSPTGGTATTSADGPAHGGIHGADAGRDSGRGRLRALS